MSRSNRNLLAFAFASALTIASIILSAVSYAAEHTIEMRNKDDQGQTMAFQPSFLKIAVGDTVKFVPTDKSHNAESVKDVWVEGAAPVKGALSATVEFKAENEGVYVFKCLPHFAMGMIAVVQVGKPENLDKVKTFVPPGVAKARLAKILEGVTP